MVAVGAENRFVIPGQQEMPRQEDQGGASDDTANLVVTDSHGEVHASGLDERRIMERG